MDLGQAGPGIIHRFKCNKTGGPEKAENGQILILKSNLGIHSVLYEKPALCRRVDAVWSRISILYVISQVNKLGL